MTSGCHPDIKDVIGHVSYNRTIPDYYLALRSHVLLGICCFFPYSHNVRAVFCFYLSCSASGSARRLRYDSDNGWWKLRALLARSALHDAFAGGDPEYHVACPTSDVCMCMYVYVCVRRHTAGAYYMNILLQGRLPLPPFNKHFYSLLCNPTTCRAFLHNKLELIACRLACKGIVRGPTRMAQAVRAYLPLSHCMHYVASEEAKHR